MAMKTQSTGSRGTTATVSLLQLILFLDAAFAISGMPVMVAQGAYVNFRGASMLLVFQLCYIVPQLFTTGWAETVASRLSAPVALFATVAASAVAGAVGVQGLTTHSVFLFFFARFLNGLFRHEKLFSRLTAAKLGVAPLETGSWSLYGAMAGMLTAGAYYDWRRDAIAVARLFFYVELAAAALAGILAMRAVTSKVQPNPVVDSVAAYRAWLRNIIRAPSAAALRNATLLLLAGAFLASTHQSMYAMVDPFILQSYTWTGVHLASGIALGVWGIPWLRARLVRVVGEAALPTVVLALLSLSSAALPVVVKNKADHRLGCLVYLLVAGAFDVSAGLLIGILAARLRTAAGTENPQHAAQLSAHIVFLARLLGAATRLFAAQLLPKMTYSLHAVALPLGVIVAVQLYNGSPSLALGASVVACAAMLSIG